MSWMISGFIYANNEPKSALARELGDCRDNKGNIVFLEVRPSLRRIPASHHAFHVRDRDKSVGIFCLDIVHKLTIFLLCEDRQDLALLGIAVAAGGRVDSDAALEILDHIAAEFIVVFGDHAHPDLSGELIDKVVQHETAEVGRQSTDDHGLKIVGEIGARDRHHAGDDDRLAEIQMEIFVHDLRDNIETAGCRVGVEEDRLSETDHNDHTNYIQGDVPRRRARIREGGFKYEEKYREQDGDKDDLCPKGLIYKEER